MSRTANAPQKRIGVRRHPGVSLAIFALALFAQPASAAPPTNRTYFTILLGIDANYSWQPECLRFSRSQVCTSEGECGSWFQTEPGPDGAFSFEIEIGGDEAVVVIDGQARFENRGKKEAIGGTVQAEVEGDTFTFALSGKSMSRSKCLRLLENWQ